MRVIGGIYRGRRLAAPDGGATRPTGSKVREAVFDILGAAVEDASFLDLFAGSGAVGIEALSRGASTCAFVEGSPKALRCLRDNIESLVPPPRFRLLPFTVPKALKILRDTGFRADILFGDPPYASRDWPELLLSIPGYGVLSESPVVVIEHAAVSPPLAPPEWGEPRRYRYGDTALAVYRVKREEREAGSGEPGTRSRDQEVGSGGPEAEGPFIPNPSSFISHPSPPHPLITCSPTLLLSCSPV